MTTTDPREVIAEAIEAALDDTPLAPDSSCVAAQCMNAVMRGLAEAGLTIEPAWISDMDAAPKGSGLDTWTTDPAFVKAPTILLLFPDGEQVAVYWDWYYAPGGSGYEGDDIAWVVVKGQPLAWETADRPVAWRPLPPEPGGEG